MQQVMGVINLINELDQLEELTYRRCVASVPFGGRYRLIDFILSSFVNSGISNVSVFAHTRYRSLMDHLGSGKEWDLDRKRNGLYILPPAADEIKEILKGDLYHFYTHRDYFARSPQEYVVVARSHMVCNIDFRKVFEQHQETGADITMVYQHTASQTHASTRRVILDDTGLVTDMQDHNGRLDSDAVSMEMFLMKKELLLDLVETSLAQGYDHFIRDGIMKNIHKLKVFGYAHAGYLGVVNTLQSYFQHSLCLLEPGVWKDLFYRPGLIYTKIKDEPPTKYASGSAVKNALIANGCIVEGEVENCILFRGVKVGSGSKLKNSIILQNTTIEQQVVIENAIIDKDVHVHSERMLRGEASVPFIAGKGKII